VELVVNDTTDSPNSASYLHLYLKHDINGTVTTKLYDKRDDFNFPVANYPFLDSNSLYRSVLLTRKLLNQGFIETRLISIL